MGAALAGPEQVLDYWLGSTPWEHQERWYAGGPEVDQEIRDRFGPTIAAAVAGQLDDWAATPAGRVALVIVLDQFTRNAYRDSPAAFSGDERAQGFADVPEDFLRELPPDHAYCLAMPFMHAEDAALQHRSVARFVDLARRTPSVGGLDYAIDHAAIVQAYGRFPDRNQLLGRPSTPEEQQFLRAVQRPWFEHQDA